MNFSISQLQMRKCDKKYLLNPSLKGSGKSDQNSQNTLLPFPLLNPPNSDTTKPLWDYGTYPTYVTLNCPSSRSI